VLAGAARDAGHPVALFERPMPEAVSVLGLGSRHEITTQGLDEAIAAWRDIAGDLGPDAIALVGFAFHPDRAPQGPWAGFPGVLIRVPDVAVVRRRGRTSAVVATDQAEELLETAPLFRSPAPREVEFEPARPPDDWCAAVAEATRRLRAGVAEKVVLAREVIVHGDGALDAGGVARALRTAYPACFTYLFSGDDGTAFVGASPELLVRRMGLEVMSQPMAGSVPRGADDSEDDRLAAGLLSTARTAAEHAIVPAAVAEALAQFSDEVDRGHPEVVRFTNIQHLATTVRARLRDSSTSALEIAAALHPTPAVGGYPLAPALAMIDELEALERGWYAGAVGWIDGRGDGELAIAIRCGLLWGDGARLYAGNGIMPDSDPAGELEETEVKLRALTGALLSGARR
jgi:salicylate biosynthesis isochorismate synthase/menaquinone-specific isochorismate synthase